MSEKYYRYVNTSKDIVKFKLQLGTILLKLNEHNSSISTINDTLDDNKEKMTGYNSSISTINNTLDDNKEKMTGYDSSISTINDTLEDNKEKMSGYDSSISTINVTLEDNKEKINEKGDYMSIDKKYNVENQAFRFKRTVHFYKIIEIVIEDDFNTDMIINFSNNIYYKYFDVKNDKQRLEHEYQFYNGENSFYKKLIKKSDGNINLNDNTIIMNNKFDINIKDDFKKLKIILMLHRVNREGYGDINLDIFDDVQNNLININYKKQINTKDNLKLSDGYIIKDIFMYNLRIKKDYILKDDLNLEVFSYKIQSDFKKGDFLHISCYTFFSYINYTYINAAYNKYVLYYEHRYLQEMYFLHRNTGNSDNNYSSNYNDFYMKLLDNYDILEIKLFVSKDYIWAYFKSQGHFGKNLF